MASRKDKRTQRDVRGAAGVERNVGVPGEPQRHAGPEAGHERNVRAGDAKVPPETIAARLATQQQGVVSWKQLRSAGVGPGAIKRCASNGHLHRKHRSVYVVGHTAPTPLAAETAALLACGPRAVLSHWLAAHVFRLIEQPPDEVHITLVGRRCRPKEGVRLHVCRALDRRDLRRQHGLLVSAPARILIDLAAEEELCMLERLVAEARVQKLLHPGELEAAIERAGRRRGVAGVRRLLESEQGPALTRSEAERLLRRLTRDAGLPPPACNARVAGLEVDFLWPQQRLVLEVDGFRFHGHRGAFERDAARAWRLRRPATG